MRIDELKKDYAVFEKRYKLPSFSELNENFEIEKIRRKSDTLVKMVRKVMMEKIVNTLGLMETLVNPSNAPRLYFAYLRSMSAEDKQEIEKIYNVLSEIVAESMGLEINYSENGEGELICKIMSKWNSLKPSLNKIIDGIKKPNSIGEKKEKSYFG